MQPNTLIGAVLFSHFQEADIAVGDITITRERLEYVDFTVPYLQNDLGILYSNVHHQFADTPQFLRPWTSELWICLLTALLGTTLLFAFVSRLSSAEWVFKRSQPPNRKHAGRRGLRNRFSLSNSFWFLLASILQQGTDVFPR